MIKVYIDTNVWGRPFDVPSDRIISESEAFFQILEGVNQHKFTIVSSLILEDEVSQK